MIIDKPALDLLFWGEEKFSALPFKNKVANARIYKGRIDGDSYYTMQT